MKKQILILPLIFLLLFGCKSRLTQLHETRPVGSKFQKHISGLYLGFAQEEADQYDWFDSNYFASKGLDAANGNRTSPEELPKWDIDDDYIEITGQARNLLLNVLTEENKDKYPIETATAQFSFDCWIEELEEKTDGINLKLCRERLYKNIDILYGYGLKNTDYQKELLSKHNSMVDSAKTTSVNKVNIEPKIIKNDNKLQLPNKNIVFFNYNSYELTPEAIKEIDKLVKKIDNLKNYKLTVNGYADRSGRKEYNMVLSHKRAKKIQEALISRGVSKDLIDIFAFGENDISYFTADGVPSSANRIAEIIIDNS